MKKLTVGPGQAPVVLVLLRKLFPQDAFITHYSKGQKKWFADLVMTGQRWSGDSRRELFDKFSTHILQPTKGTGKRGRPIKGTKPAQFYLTPQVRTYLSVLAGEMQIDLSTCVSYLVCKAYQALLEAREDEPTEPGDPEFEDLTDDRAVIENIRQQAFKEQPKPKTAKSVIEEMKAANSKELDEIARKIREQLRDEELAKSKKPKKVDVNALRDLKIKEKLAEERLKAKNDELHRKD